MVAQEWDTSPAVIDLPLSEDGSLSGATFTELMTQYQGRVYGQVLAIVRRPLDAEDIAQEVWLSAARSISQLRDPSRFKPWVLRIARNAALDFIDRGKVRPAAVPLDDLDPASEPRESDHVDPQTQLALKERYHSVWKAMEALGERDRHALLLREVQGYSYQEIADSLKVSSSTAQVVVCRARQRFREHFAKVESVGSAPGEWESRALNGRRRNTR